VEFSKIFKNKYVVFKYHHWDYKHPYGVLSEVLGDVDSMDAFHKYQLYSRYLNHSLNPLNNRLRSHNNREDDCIANMQKDTRFSLSSKSSIGTDPNTGSTPFIFTIDPKGSTDLDDAFSIEPIDRGFCITVYIAHVAMWLETLDIWDLLSKRVSTVYLPDNRYTMLPSQLSDNWCSLLEGKRRPTFCMEITVDSNGCILGTPSYKNAIITVSKNYDYDDTHMLNCDTYYRQLFDITKKMDSNVSDSHEMVAFWMMQMNADCAKYMSTNHFGIFRAVQHNPHPSTTTNNEVSKMLNRWRNTTSHYVVYSDDSESLNHSTLGLDSYVHITSPIRRLVDVLNQTTICIHMGLFTKISSNGYRFLENWTREIDYINVAAKNIRKIQNECDLLHRVIGFGDNSSRTYMGTIFDTYKKSFLVYLADLNYAGKVDVLESTATTIVIGETYEFRLYVFADEYLSRRKIRIGFVNSQDEL